MNDKAGKSMVWVSRAFGSTLNRRSLTNAIIRADIKQLIALQQRNEAGEPLGPECFADEIWPADAAPEREYKNLTDLFFCGGCWIVSNKAAEVMRRFDLGQGALYPVRLVMKDRTTPIGDSPWFCLNFGNRKSAFLAEESAGVDRSTGRGWLPPIVMEDNGLTVSQAAAIGPDLWVDPELRECFFMSEALGRALRKAKAAKGFQLVRCRVNSGATIPILRLFTAPAPQPTNPGAYRAP